MANGNFIKGYIIRFTYRCAIRWNFCEWHPLISQFQPKTLWADPIVVIKDQERDNFSICRAHPYAHSVSFIAAPWRKWQKIMSSVRVVK